MAINFDEYHAKNPHIWEAFKKYAWEAKRKGFKNYSANGIFEIIRWHTPVAAEGHPPQFKIGNNFRPDYARKLMDEDPENFAGFFRTRALKAPRVAKATPATPPPPPTPPPPRRRVQGQQPQQPGDQYNLF